MRFPIDAVFLDRELAVVGIEDSIAPWRAAQQRGAKACSSFRRVKARAAGSRSATS
jgi:uncharacterized membrane protein (UPF0127 family)